MTKNNSIQQFSFWGNVIQFGKKIISNIRMNLRDFSIRYPNSSQVIQLTFIYLFAFSQSNLLSFFSLLTICNELRRHQDLNLGRKISFHITNLLISPQGMSFK